MNLGSGIAVPATDASAGFGPYQQKFYTFSPPPRPFLGIGNVFAYQNVVVRFEKAVTVARGQRASIVLDVFNAFKSKNWGCYDTFIIPTANQATDLGWQQRFNKPTCAALGRRSQLGLRYAYR